jgi:hypothetical protein
MKLSTIVNDDELDALLEATAKPKDDSDIIRPYGISKDEFTPEFIRHLKRLRVNDPLLYNKVISGQ